VPTALRWPGAVKPRTEINVPVESGVSQVLKIGSQPISIAAMAKYWAVRPDGAPAWGARFVPTFLFPK
jgi:hypothetical protein